MMRMAMGGGGGDSMRLLELDIGSKLPPAGPPAAEHPIPPGMSNGPEQNIIHPLRPKDPKVDWVQEWAVEARYVLRPGAFLGMDEMAGGARRAGSPAASRIRRVRPGNRPKS
jgi:hypothetical protein